MYSSIGSGRCVAHVRGVVAQVREVFAWVRSLVV